MKHVPTPHLDRERRATLRRLALPAIATDVAAMRRFAGDHGLDLRGRRGYLAFREARRFGIDLLPPMALEGQVVDVGANEGQFAGALLKVAPRARVLAVEPEPATADRLRTRFAGDDRLAVVQTALGASVGRGELHVTDNPVFASLRRPVAELEDQYPRGTAVADIVEVQTTTLDDVVAEPVSVLKIDVQGSEHEVLTGGSRVLAETAAVLIEMNFVEHYEGEASFAVLHDLLLDAGLRLVGLGELKRSATTGYPLWADACYAHPDKVGALR
jgi:FkbM family methyltransferase